MPWWLGEAYPSLFQYPSQIDRVRIYSIAYDVRDLLAIAARRAAAAPARAPRVQPPPARRARKSYIDVLGRGRI